MPQAKSNVNWQWVEPRGEWQSLPADRQMTKNIEDRIRGVYQDRGCLGLAFDKAATPEEAKALHENGLVNAGTIDGTEMWLVDPNRVKGAIERDVESSYTKGNVMGWKETVSSVRGELGSMYLQGLNDLHSAIVPAFPDSQRGVDQMGTPLAPTPQMVHDAVEPQAMSAEAADYGRESDRSYDAMLERYASQQREQEPELERE